MEEMQADVYTKEELAASERFKRYRDAVSALLEDGKSYSVEEAEKIIKKFMKGRV
ncbi:MAG: hypothetical protein LUG52_06645 [Clostridia bacterium]|nr:hypothetical protein [Clostridia bacterium]